MTQQPETITPLEQATRLVASNQLAATSALQRWMRISFRESSDLLNQMQELGHVGPAEGSRAREVYVRRCEQCGRVGRRSFRTHSSFDIRVTVCANTTACRKRWPKHPVDDE
ncbi:DNA translocase FtsK [Streptomyces sp. NPDC020196]|uniref:DNA translocase FtsK n=1 Tax=Streptomyces sp. NPDC020196 TaxID=3156656 RepID=UPI0033D4F6C1